VDRGFPDPFLDGFYLLLYPAGFPFSVVDGYFCNRSLAGFHDGRMTFFDEFHNLTLVICKRYRLGYSFLFERSSTLPAI